jgi:hypothetical protein
MNNDSQKDEQKQAYFRVTSAAAAAHCPISTRAAVADVMEHVHGVLL